MNDMNVGAKHKTIKSLLATKQPLTEATSEVGASGPTHVASNWESSFDLSSLRCSQKMATTFSLRIFKAYMCQGLNSHYFHIIGNGHQPKSRGLYAHYKASY